MVYTPVDQKPKVSPDPHALGRVRDILLLPDVTLLVDRWDEDWSRLAWLRAYGAGDLLEPGSHGQEEHQNVVCMAGLQPCCRGDAGSLGPGQPERECYNAITTTQYMLLSTLCHDLLTM